MSDREEGSISESERSPLSPGERERSPTPASNKGSESGARRRSRSRSRSHRSRGSPGPRSVSRDRSRSRSRRRSYRSRSRSRSPRRRRSSGRYGGRRRSRSRSPMSRRRRHMGSREDPKSSRCLGVFGLSLYTQERDLRDHFTRYGPVDEVQIVYDHQTGRSRGFAFLYMRNLEDAMEAKERAPGTEIDGRTIRVDYSITKRAHTPTPGIYLGKPTTSGRYDDRRRDRDDRDHYGGGYRGRSPSPYGGGGYGGRRGRYSRSRSRDRERSFSPREP